ncbi:MAG: PDZ domain-containing protein [Terriglobia bacterium]
MKHKLALGALVVLGSSFLTGGAVLAQRARTVHQDVQILTNDGGWLGVRLEDVTAQKAQDLKVPGQYGALVTEVEPESPAAKAGLQVNDVIVDFAGEKVRSVAGLRRMVRETPADRTVPVEILRNGERSTLNVTIEARHGDGNELFSFSTPMPEGPELRLPPHAFEFAPPGPLGNGWFGGARLDIRGEDLTEQLAGYFGVKQGKGVLVAEVEKGSAAEKAGLRAGDCIVRVDAKDVASVDELHEALTNSHRGPSNKSQVTLTIVRDHHEQSLPVTLEEGRMEPMMESLDNGAVSLRPEDLAEVEAEIAALGPELQEEAARWQRQWPEETQQLREQIQAAAKAQVAAQTAAARAQLAGQLETMRRQLKDQNSELHQAMEQARKQSLDQQKERLQELRRELGGLDIL